MSNKTATLIEQRQETLAKPRKIVRRRYTDKFRAGAILMVEGSPLTSMRSKLEAVSKELKVPLKTLRNWVEYGSNPPDEESKAEMRLELGQMIDLEINEIVKEMRVAREGASYRDLAIAFGIMFDKRQLLNGQSTENVQQQISFVRTGISSLPEHLAPRAIEDLGGEEEV